MRLYGFFDKNPDVCFTARELFDRMEGVVSLSAVYRNLAEMEKAGLVSASIGADRMTRRYRLACHHNCARHLHFSCERCGQISHLTESQTEEMCRLFAASGLQLDLAKTVVNGYCTKCRGLL